MTNITLSPVQPDQPSQLMVAKRSALYEDEGRIYIRQMVRNT